MAKFEECVKKVTEVLRGIAFELRHCCLSELYQTNIRHYKVLNTFQFSNFIIPKLWPFFWSRRFVCATRGGSCKHSWSLLTHTFFFLFLLHTLLFTHFGCQRKLIFGMPPYFDLLQRYPGSWFSVSRLEDLCNKRLVTAAWATQKLTLTLHILIFS